MGSWCVYNGSIYKPILWGHNACMLLMHILRTNSYMHLCMVSSEGSMSSMKDQLYGKSKCTKSGYQKEYTCTEDTCNNTQEVRYV